MVCRIKIISDPCCEKVTKACFSATVLIILLKNIKIFVYIEKIKKVESITISKISKEAILQKVSETANFDYFRFAF